MPLIKCPECSNQISDLAFSCPSCGYTLRKQEAQEKVAIVSAPFSPGIAAVLSFLIPGLGQIYKTQILGGLIWFMVVLIGYFFLVIPGLILHLICIISAASGGTKIAIKS